MMVRQPVRVDRLQHQLRTPVNNLIGEADVVLFLHDLSRVGDPAYAAEDERIRARLRGEGRSLAGAALVEGQVGLRLRGLDRGHELAGLHANTQIPKIIGFQRVYEANGDDAYHNAAAFFWRTVAHTRAFATGGHGDGEHFFAMADFDKHVFSAKGSETCCQHNMLKLTRALFLRDPQAEYADYYERTLYNGILASQDPDSGMATLQLSNSPTMSGAQSFAYTGGTVAWTIPAGDGTKTVYARFVDAVELACFLDLPDVHLLAYLTLDRSK